MRQPGRRAEVSDIEQALVFGVEENPRSITARGMIADLLEEQGYQDERLLTLRDDEVEAVRVVFHPSSRDVVVRPIPDPDEKVFVRIGHEAGYEEFDDLDSLGEFLEEFYPSIGTVEAIPGNELGIQCAGAGYSGRNYISLYFGPDVELAFRGATADEIYDLNGILRDYRPGGPWIVQDWTGRRMYADRSFGSFESAWEHVCTHSPEEDWEDIYVLEGRANDDE